MLKSVSPQQSQDLRDDIEQDLHDHVSTQLRDWLADVRRAAVTAALSTSPNVLLAAASDEMPGMGTIAQWWAQRVDTTLVEAVRASLYRAFNRWTDQRIDASPAMEATNTYLGNVRDRLVQGTHFGVPVYEDSFDRIRLALATSAAEGWTRPQLANRIAAELSWEEDGPYWRGVKADADFKIDSILDPLGAPGTPAREMARLNDPVVQRLRDQRNYAIKHLDAERSVWQTRANLIARTESTGGANFGAHQALIAEGMETKAWVATGDTRTRPTHRDADSQERPIDRRFRVGTALLQFPGDPAGPVEEIAACRCTIIGVGEGKAPATTEAETTTMESAPVHEAARGLQNEKWTLPERAAGEHPLVYSAEAQSAGLKNRAKYARQGPVQKKVANVVENWTMTSARSVQGVRDQILRGELDDVVAAARNGVEAPTLYRGLRGAPGSEVDDLIRSMQVGGKVDLRGLSSFTDDPEWAKFFGGANKERMSVAFEVRGARGLPVNKISNSPGENEWLVNGEIEVTKILERTTTMLDDGTEVVHLRVEARWVN